MMADHTASGFWGGWRHRLRALRNIPPVLKMVWDAGPSVVSASMGLRLLGALAPVAILSISKLIIDGVVAAASGKQPLTSRFWWRVALELVRASVPGGRAPRDGVLP